MTELTLQGLNYYQTYDRFFLGTSIVCGFLGWMTYILTFLLEEHSGIVRSKVKLDIQGRAFWQNERFIQIVFAIIGAIMTVLLYVQSLPWTNYLYCLIPVGLWMVVLQRSDILLQLFHHIPKMKGKWSLCCAVAVCIIGLEILVIGFFYRQVLPLGLLIMAVLPWISVTMTMTKKPLYLWSLCCVVVAIFPMMPVVTGKRHTSCILIGGAVVSAMGAVSIYRSDVKTCWNNRILSCIQLLLVIISTYFSGHAVVNGLLPWQQGISWAILGSSVVISVLGPTKLHLRLRRIFLAFVAPFLLLSVSYEILFVISLYALLYSWLNLELNILEGGYRKSQISQKQFERLDFKTSLSQLTAKPRDYLVSMDIQRAFYFIFLILTAFFGTGNIASINSFDPSSVLCFVSVFSPFIMGALLLLKVIIPFILVTCCLQAVHVVCRVPVKGLFLLILLMSDYMALHFFFLVQDTGSWLDIGTSISHYVIVMCMNIFIMLLIGLSHFLTHFTVTTAFQGKQLSCD